ncbi:MAG: hypothetical protein GWN94_08890 [Phycisphaerae bacterium]|nr:hypothetical protein [Phycisphaerae bacterium]
MAKKGKKMVQVAISFDKELLDRVDEHVKLLRTRMPGIRIGRTDVIRMFVLKGLEAEEGK